MPRYTSELVVEKVGNRYDLILLASRRARELASGWAAKVTGDNGPLITALKEIEEGAVGREYLAKPQNLDRKERQHTGNK